MLEIKFVRQNLSQVQAALEARGGAGADLETFEKCDERLRVVLQEVEELRHRRNVVSARIAEMKKNGEDAGDVVLEMRDVSSRIKELEKSLTEDEAMIQNIIT